MRITKINLIYIKIKSRIDVWIIHANKREGICGKWWGYMGWGYMGKNNEGIWEQHMPINNESIWNNTCQ